MLAGHAADVFEHYAVDVNRWVWRLLGPDPEHNDMVQQVFVDAIATVPHDAPDFADRLRARAVMSVRSELQRRRRPFSSYKGGAPVGSALARRVYALLSAAGSDAQLAFVVHCIDGTPLEETAVLLATSAATIKRRVKSAEDALRAANDSGLPRGTCSEIGAALADELGDGARFGDLSRQKAGLVAHMSQKQSMPWLPMVIAGALACVALVAGLLLVRTEEATFEINGVIGHAGQQVVAEADEVPIIFADGSMVRMLTGSALRVDAVDARRVVVRLIRGSLAAHVRHSTAARWELLAGGFDVHVAGTHLTVALGEGVKISVSEGAVRVSGQGLPAEGVSVEQGMRMDASADGRYVVTPNSQ